MYAVFDGTHYNGACCFDYGNAETDNLDTGDALMEALYFGLGTGYNTGAGQGPWILAGMLMFPSYFAVQIESIFEHLRIIKLALY